MAKPRRFRPVTREDVADDNPTVIARQLRMLQGEMRDGFELLANRIMTRLDAHESRIDRLENQVTDLRRHAGNDQPAATRPRKGLR